jgi:tetratricopeptide (TPR) repeat protein
MSEEQARQFLEQATQSLQSGQFQQALELADQSIALRENDAEAHILRGIALSQLGQPEPATEALRRAISLAPQNPKAYYNLAVHAYSQGQKAEALEMAREAVRLDSKHAGARDLVARVEAEMRPQDDVAAPRAQEPAAPTEAPGAPSQPSAPYQSPYQQPPGGYVRPGYESSGVHSLQFVENMGKTWDAIGWGLVITSLVVFVASIFLFMPLYMEMFRDPENISRMNMMGLGGGALSIVIQLVSWAATLASLVWMILELSDRRGNWLWMLPYIICCCCGFHWIVLGIYLIAGRTK